MSGIPHGKLTAFNFDDDELLVVQIPEYMNRDEFSRLSESLEALAKQLDIRVFIAPMGMDFSKLNETQKLQIRKSLGCTCNP